MFIPPFCPESTCSLHRTSGVPESGWYRRAGSYETLTFGTVPRYVCKLCGKGFSRQTFSIDYYAKRLVHYRALVSMLKSCSGTRDISRDLRVSTGTVANRCMRLARQALAVSRELADSFCLREPLVADGFESFVVSQYFPNNINLLLGAGSEYLFHLTYVPLRRKGRMTEEQKRRREELEQLYLPPPKAIERGFEEVCDRMLELRRQAGDIALELRTDEHAAYDRVVRRHPELCELTAAEQFTHVRVSSKKPRVPGSLLFAANYMDREIRKDLGNHVRETVKFARNVNDCLARLAVYIAHHNGRKVYRINKEREDGRTHAEVAGATKEAVQRAWLELFGQRKFLTLQTLDEAATKIWLREYETPLSGPSTVPKYARM